MEFKREYLCEWVKPDPNYKMAFDLWVDYYYLTEQYDQKVCSGKTDEGVAMPIGYYEYGLINQNAKLLKNQLTNIANEYEIDDKTLKAAQNDVLRYSQLKINELYNELHNEI